MAKSYDVRHIELRAVVFTASPKGLSFQCVRETKEDAWSFPGGEFKDEPSQILMPLTILEAQLKEIIINQLGIDIRILTWLTPVLEPRGEESDRWCRLLLYALAEPVGKPGKRGELLVQSFPVRRLIVDFDFHVEEKIVEAHRLYHELKKEVIQ
jgi:hypothetical protein